MDSKDSKKPSSTGVLLTMVGLIVVFLMVWVTANISGDSQPSTATEADKAMVRQVPVVVDDPMFGPSGRYLVIEQPTVDSTFWIHRLVVQSISRPDLVYSVFDPSRLIQQGEEVTVREFRSNYAPGADKVDSAIDKLHLAYWVPSDDPAP